MQRIVDIPSEVTVSNPTYELINLLGLASIEGRVRGGPPPKGVIKLYQYSEVHRARLWQAIKNCIFGGILIQENPTEATNKDPVEGAEDYSHSYSGPVTVEPGAPVALNQPIVPADDFSIIQGITPLLARRLVALGYRTYQQVLNSDEQVLLKIDGINRTNIEVITASMFTKIQLPEPAVRPVPPEPVKNDVPEVYETPDLIK